MIAATEKRLRMLNHVADLLDRGLLLHLQRCDVCKLILKLPLDAQKELVATAGRMLEAKP